MQLFAEHGQHFAKTVSETINMMLGANTTAQAEMAETSNPSSNKTFHVGIYFTGMVYGEYLLSMDESTALGILGIPADAGHDTREHLQDAFTEILNTAVGGTIIQLRETYKKLTFAAPRVVFGEVRYPEIHSSKSTVISDSGEIECHFYLDTMRLELATSYEQVMNALVKSNKTLEDANKQLKEQQAHLLHAEKMASLGIMAAGVAHEINNPLAFVNSNFNALESYVDTLIGLFSIYQSLEASLSDIAPQAGKKLSEAQMKEHIERLGQYAKQKDMYFVIEDTRELLEDSKEGLDRIRKIITGLREFSHVDGEGQQESDLNDIIENTISMVWNQIKYSSELEKDFGVLPKIFVHPGEISQVITNILINASHAVSENGMIKICSTADDSYVRVSIQDNGSGIEPDNLTKIFNPFFTTKGVGEGTGLGLSISHNIIQNHGGKLEVESELGVGTTFTITLPVKKPVTEQPGNA